MNPLNRSRAPAEVESLWLCGLGGRDLEAATECIVTGEGGFRRADVNADESLDLADAIAILQYLFVSGAGLTCLSSADTDDSGRFDLTDAILVLSYLFLGGSPPAPPFGDCGVDPTRDALDCDAYALCGAPSLQRLVTPSSRARFRVPRDDDLGLDRTETNFDDSAWTTASAAIGYDEADTYDALIGTDIDRAMNGVGTSVYLRVPFDVRSPETHRLLVLRVRYDDGFVAYLNGWPVASRNAPAEPTFDSTATTTHDDELAVEFEDFEIPVPAARLRAGDNVLAIHGLNVSLGSSDFLLSVELATFR